MPQGDGSLYPEEQGQPASQQTASSAVITTPNDPTSTDPGATVVAEPIAEDDNQQFVDSTYQGH